MTTEHIRKNLHERIAALRADVRSYFEAAHPSLAYLRRPIDHGIDDAGMLLDMDSVRHDYFVPYAASVLDGAERQFQTIKGLIAQYGGPQNARVVGGD